MSILTCRKIYTDIPWAHRQHRHDGHCAFVHGHNWSISITFGCHEPDASGFVVDFGKLKYLKGWIDEHLDHACVLCADDPLLPKLDSIGGAAVWKTYVVPDCSCEGMAQHLFETLGPMVHENTNGRAFIATVEVGEDSKNSASFSVPFEPRGGSDSHSAVSARHV